MTAAPTVPAVWQVVHAEALDTGRTGGRLPDPPVEVAPPQVRALAAQNTNAPGRTVRHHRRRHRHPALRPPLRVVPDPISGTPMVVARGRHHTERTVIHSLGNSS
jgi:hypothetical protein